MCGRQLWMTLPLNSEERFLQTLKIRAYVYRTNARGRKTVVVDTNMPTRLLITVLTHDNFTTGQLAQYTFGIALPHNGSVEAKKTQVATEKAG